MDASAVVYTKDHSDDFFVGLRAVAESLQANPEHLLCVMQSESGVSAKAFNPGGHASGLVQFMPDTLRNEGWSDGDEAFRRLTSTEQLPFVERYFAPHRGLLTSIAAIYVATFLPALVAHADEPDYVLCAKEGQLSWAYGPNASFDANHDLAITVRELEAAVTRNCVGPRWAELQARLHGMDSVPEGWGGEREQETFLPDLRTTYGIQCALKRLGIDPGPLDGVPGAMTRWAVSAFQHRAGLPTDCIVGPDTRAALEKALDAV